MPDATTQDDDYPLPQSDRLQILTPEEYELLWGLPQFSDSDRAIYFQLTPRDEGVLSRLRTPRSKAHFLLQLGYFRARQRFFQLDTDQVHDDLSYVCRQYLDNAHITDLAVSLHTRFQHFGWITELFGYRMFARDDRVVLEQRALDAARISSRPLYVLRDLIDRLRQQRIVLPGYTYLQDVVRRALSFERNRLSETLAASMTHDDKKLLDRLLRDDDGLHAVTAIKHHPRDFSHKQIITEIERGEQLLGLYQVAVRIITDTDLSVESVRFYASLVDYYTVYKLKRMNRTMTRLYLLCFVRDRYQRLNDHLISAFCALVRRYTDEVNERAKDAYYQHRRQANEDIDQGAKVLFLFVDPKVPDNRPFGDVRAQAETMLPSDRIARLCEHLSGNNDFDEGQFEWQAVDAIMAKVKRNLRPLIRFLSWSATPAYARLLDVVQAMSDAFSAGKQLPDSAIDPVLVPDRHRRYIFSTEATHRFRYEFLVYRQLRDRIEAGDVFCTQ
ncbi:MAG: DUF4158 domain-containing protein, partial [Gammaproteobacteria bacterium]|nr:DUF4158 domain-containing protein [Gammaproteobacteria bacterium]